MRYGTLTRRLWAACLLLLTVPWALAQSAATPPQDIRIQAGPLADALQQFVQQTDVQVIYRLDQVQGLQSEGSDGGDSHAAILSDLIQGTGLELSRDPSGAMAVVVPLPPEGSAAPESAIVDIDSARRAGVEEIIVTGQKKAERLQDVPIAISAFSMEQLDAQKIEGGFDLLKGVPNVTFSKSNFSGYNFQIRGIGTQAISATTDPGVAIAMNNTTLIVNRLFEQEYVDIERVEVLRGPQGTLFGRNATSGVVNVISAKPVLGEESGEIKLETGNYNAKRLRGHYNLPLGDRLALRAAYASTVRDGYGTNLAATDSTRQFGDDVREDVDGRDLWTGRITLGWEPTDRVRANLMWERFEEDDNRVRTSKQLCHHDPGLGNEIFNNYEWNLPFPRAGTSQGCLPGSLYSAGAFGTPNGASLPYVSGLFIGPAFGTVGLVGAGQLGLGGNPFWDLEAAFGFPGGNDFVGTNPDAAPCQLVTLEPIFFPINFCDPDPYRNQTQSRDLRTIYSQLEPRYQADADIIELSIDFQLSDEMLFSSQTVYVTDEYFATQDYNRYSTFPIFNDSTLACAQTLIPGFGEIPNCNSPDPYAVTPNHPEGFYYNLTPGGIFTDPQLGPSNSLVAQDLSEVSSRQFNQEFRVVSSFDGPLNFSAGANLTRFDTYNDYYVFINSASLLTHFFPFNTHLGCYNIGQPTPDAPPCIYVDPNPLGQHNGEGHNYFRSANPYELRSSAVFGELYWNLSDALKLTLGLRMTWDEKRFTPIPSQLLLADYRLNVPEGAGPDVCTSPDPCQLRGTGVNGRGSPPNPDIIQQWREPTGRIVLDWKPVLGFTDETLVYASLSRGYKGGGANPPIIAPPAGEFQRTRGYNAVPPTFDPEYINAVELGTKNTLFGGALMLNGAAFFYDYTDYQVSKIVDRSAANENFDARTWGLELEAVFAPSADWQFNAAVGWLQTRIANGEQSIDLMDRTQGGNQFFITQMPNPDFDPASTPRAEADFVAGLTQADGSPLPSDQPFIAFDQWTIIKPSPTYSSNCIAPVELIEPLLVNRGELNMAALCPTGQIAGNTTAPGQPMETPVGNGYNPSRDSPNRGAGFFADLSGNELPQAPEFTLALGSQYNLSLTPDWLLTTRVDWYWQAKSFARVYNTEYDQLRAWNNTNVSVWVNNPGWGLRVEAYVKNLFNETPITGAFLNSDDSGLTTNVFTLDPRLVGLSITKQF